MYYFIINPKSRTGNGQKVWVIVKSQLEKSNIQYKEYHTKYAFHATEIAREICEEHPEMKHLIVLGGDGTVNEVINGIDSYQNIILGYIPSGSSNDLARSLHIPKDPLKGLEHILSPKNYPYFDHGLLQINHHIPPIKDTTDYEKGRKFAVSTGIGFDASVCYEVMNSKLKKFLNKIKLGKLTYGIIALKQLIRYQPCDGELLLDNTRSIKLKKIFFVVSMIQPYEGGGFKMTPHANPKDRKLSICVFYDIPKLKALIMLPSVIFGKHLLFKGAKVFECETIEITTKESLIVHTDGEYIGSCSHLKVSCTPEQIRMISPSL